MRNPGIEAKEWIRANCRFAQSGHGDTHDGQLMKRKIDDLEKDVSELRKEAASGLGGVIDRFRLQVRRAIETLPSVEKVSRMDLFQATELRKVVDRIKAMVSRYEKPGR